MASTGANLGSGYITVSPKLESGFGGTLKSQVESSVSGEALGSSIGGKITAGFAAKVGVIAGLAQSVIGGAVNVIGSSLGAAVSRVDTMNAFPRVMQNLGYSAEEAQVQIGRMSDGIKGLPTTLPAMTSMVQQLAPMTSGISEATTLGLAFNDMLVAGGSSTEMQTAAMQQYTQMLAKGKPEMQDWRSLQMAMPGQLDQVAKSMLGASANSNDLYQALQNGTISMDDFNNAIMNLDQNGASGFASFQQQAKDATGGIATNITNLKTSIVNEISQIIGQLAPQINGVIGFIRGGVETAGGAIVGFISGLTSTIDFSGFQNAFKTISDAVTAAFPSDGGSASGFGSAIAGVVNGLIPILQSLAPFAGAVASAFKFIGDNASWAVPLVLMLAGAFMLIKTASSISGMLGGVASSVSGIAAKAVGAGAGLMVTAAGEEAAGAASSASAGEILAAAVAVVALGAGIALACAGVWLLANAAIGLAAAGPAAVGVMLLMVAAIAGLAIGAAILGPALTVGAVGMVAFGVSVLLVGAGIALASAGMAMLASQLPIIATFGIQAAVGIAAIGAAMLVMGAGALIGIAVLAPFAAVALIAGAACVILGAGTAIAAGGVTMLAGATMILAAAVMMMAVSIEAATEAGSAAFDAMSSAVSGAVGAISGAVSGAFDAVCNAISGAMDKAKSVVSGALDAITGFFSGLHLSLPSIDLPPLPHFTISGSFSLNPPSVPSFGVDWYARGGLFNSANIIGIGEGRYPETALPLSPTVLAGIGDGIARNMDSFDGKSGDTYISINDLTYNDDEEIKSAAMGLIRTLARKGAM